MSPKTILFLGATGGCGLSALRRSLAAGHTCIALCRTPSRLTAKLPAGVDTSKLRIEQGNAHSAADLVRVLAHPTDPIALVDAVLFAIGGAYSFSTFSIDDPHVCENGMATLVAALKQVRAETGRAGSPTIVAISTTGVTRSGTRDVPLLMVPLYHGILKVPHKDKQAMEKALVESGEERWTVVRASLLTDGSETEVCKSIRVGVEDPIAAKAESQAVGYTVSREDVGKWIFESILQGDGWKYAKKAVTVTY